MSGRNLHSQAAVDEATATLTLEILRGKKGNMPLDLTWLWSVNVHLDVLIGGAAGFNVKTD